MPIMNMTTALAPMPLAATRSGRQPRAATNPPTKMPAAPPAMYEVSAAEARPALMPYIATMVVTLKACIAMNTNAIRRK